MKEYVRQWHSKALPNISTKAFDVTWADFVDAWGKANIPLGQVLEKIWQSVQEEPLCVEGDNYDTLSVKLLVTLCKALCPSGKGE